MSAMASTRTPGPYTRADLEHTPDDGRPARSPFPVNVVPAELVR